MITLDSLCNTEESCTIHKGSSNTDIPRFKRKMVPCTCCIRMSGSRIRNIPKSSKIRTQKVFSRIRKKKPQLQTGQYGRMILRGSLQFYPRINSVYILGTKGNGKYIKEL